MKSIFILVSSILCAVAVSADIFLSLEGIKGSSTVKRYPDDIVVDSFNFGVTSNSGGTIIAREAKANVSDITISKKLDTASPVLFLYTTTGQVIPRGTLYVTKTDGSIAEMIELRNIVVTAYAQNIEQKANPYIKSENGLFVTESFSISYHQIKVTLPNERISSWFDVAKNAIF